MCPQQKHVYPNSSKAFHHFSLQSLGFWLLGSLWISRKPNHGCYGKRIWKISKPLGLVPLWISRKPNHVTSQHLPTSPIYPSKSELLEQMFVPPGRRLAFGRCPPCWYPRRRNLPVKSRLFQLHPINKRVNYARCCPSPVIFMGYNPMKTRDISPTKTQTWNWTYVHQLS